MTDFKMYTSISSMEPMLPPRGTLEDLVLEMVRASGELSGALHRITRRRVVELLRTINSYYSNLIEGHSTHPYDIERAMKEEYSDEPAKRALQLESRAHVEVERLIDERLRAEPDLGVSSSSFLCWIHREFYDRMPPEFRWIEDPETGEEIEVVPGELRHRTVRAGRHVPPKHDALDSFLRRFEDVYDPAGLSATRRVLGFAASHHRLLWIHPFLDGNGRVTRLFSGAYARRAGIDGHGLWTVSRGLARTRTDYMRALERADLGREDDFDGRGNLSLRGLKAFCEYFLETCLDQINYMEEMLEIEGLEERVTGYVNLRREGMIPGREKLRPEAKHLLVEVLHRGELPRGEAPRVSGLGTRTARKLVSRLTGEELLWSETPKAPLRLGLPIHAAEYYFPLLYSDPAVMS